ncbi:hypothetical protein AB0N05_37480 [Nocardia sp. NPDC051030]|uniref:hypothetical protein n=1 Tax=Nocardia sp. NPDC051030 TaxID=3155162 RepID=UPI003430642B
MGTHYSTEITTRASGPRLKSSTVSIQMIAHDFDNTRTVQLLLRVPDDDTIITDVEAHQIAAALLDAAHELDPSNAAQNAAFEVIGKQINLGDTRQMQVVLYDELGFDSPDGTYRTDTHTLTDLYARTAHPFLAHVIAYRNARATRT